MNGGINHKALTVSALAQGETDLFIYSLVTTQHWAKKTPHMKVNLNLYKGFYVGACV
jgi:hypothetical protein